MGEGLCPCGAELPPYGGRGRRRIYCSTKCREIHVRKPNQYSPRVPRRKHSEAGDRLWCRVCKLYKSEDDFEPHSSMLYGRQSCCLQCTKRSNGDERRKKQLLQNARKYRYGITPQEQDELWDRQEGRCAACRREFAGLNDAHVDHDHASGRVRAFLCEPCNLTVGFSHETVARLIAVAEYLLEQQDVEAEIRSRAELVDAGFGIGTGRKAS